MKNRLIITFIVMMAIMLGSLATAIATEQTPPLTISEQGTVWSIDVNIVDQSGKDVILNTIHCYWWFTDESGSTTSGEIIPYKVSIADSQIKLWFDPLAEGFPEDASESAFNAMLNNGYEIDYQGGPGFAWIRR